MKLDVYGKTLLVERVGHQWVVYHSSEGRRSVVPDIVIPESVSDAEVAGYLADLFHELATPDRPDVRRIG